jgi:hypothetical protein
MRQTIEVDVLATAEATVVEVRGGTYLETNPTFVAQGDAKKHPNDEHDPEIGHALAMARALHSLAETYEKRAQARIDRPTTRALYPSGGLVSLKPLAVKYGNPSYSWDSLSGYRFRGEA